jgi:putative flippase GtrA
MLFRFIKYSEVGVATFLLNYTVFLSFLNIFNFHYLIGTVSGLLAGNLLGFFLDEKYVFNIKKLTFSKILLFYVDVILVVFFITIFMYFLVDVYRLNEVASRLGLSVVSGAFSFFFNSKVVFKR